MSVHKLKCPTCRRSSDVVKSIFPEEGTHFCEFCEAYFTPKNHDQVLAKAARARMVEMCHDDFVAICTEFCRRVEDGSVQSTYTYQAMKLVLAKVKENSK